MSKHNENKMPKEMPPKEMPKKDMSKKVMPSEEKMMMSEKFMGKHHSQNHK